LAQRFPRIAVAQWYNVWLTNERRRFESPAFLSVFFLACTYLGITKIFIIIIIIIIIIMP
jgi:hypothetical protein